MNGGVGSSGSGSSSALLPAPPGVPSLSSNLPHRSSSPSLFNRSPNNNNNNASALSALIRNKRFIAVFSFVLVCAFFSIHQWNPSSSSSRTLSESHSNQSGRSSTEYSSSKLFNSMMNGKTHQQIEQEFEHLLKKQKETIEMRPPLDSLDKHADRFKVLMEIDRFEQSISSTTTTTKFNTNQTAIETLRKSIRFHRDQLFANLYPFVSRNENDPRTFDDLLSRYKKKAGIVIPCGNDQFHWALHLIATLKNVHRTKLPILVVHSGPNDLTIERRAALRSLSTDIETLDLLHIFDEKFVGLENSGWAIKPFALLASPFKETIICDADAIFLQDPQTLLYNQGYHDTGTLFFRDREIFPGDGNVHAWFKGLMKGRKPSKQLLSSRWYTDEASREEMESGVVVVDKGRREVALGLVFVAWLNTRAVRDAVMYKQTYGDKESYWMGLELANVPYYFDPPYAGIAGRLIHPNNAGHSPNSRICSEHHLHLDDRGRPLWWNGAIYEDKRHKEKGWFLAIHYTHGTVDWDCEPEPWCMKGIREADVKKFVDVRTDDGISFDRILSDMIGAALVAELKFPNYI